ncbi:polyhydroxyalkanoate synthesis repressor PhaR [Pararhodobacter sp.]|uniref:polyhydroxyalkanoate synthesis repressor PhaR n=1 Tax=Pararhodobacter sp. TaxID=2127056 RepID=UPI002FDD84B0
MPDTEKPLLIKRYASRRLYNTESSDYVTLEDIARFIRAGRAVQIIDLKTGDDLTRQYLLQIIAEHESRGENVLPLEVLTDLVRSYTAQAQSVVPQFLAMSFDMLRQGPGKIAEQMTAINPMMAQMSKMPGFEAMQRQQQAFMQSMMTGWRGMPGREGGKDDEEAPGNAPKAAEAEGEDLGEIKRQLAALEAKLSKLEK